ncbi:MAG: hypothetical protein GWN30_31475 [Gammaproteobacteria bacterium]|nr:hypothetical protein [Gammaproteobacteria bacterium]
MSTDQTTATIKIKILDRLLLLAAGLLAAYQIGFGISEAELIPMVSYTVAFGVLLVAGLLIIIMGFDILESPLVVIVSTLLPLGISMGIIAEHIPSLVFEYLVFVCVGFVLLASTRFIENRTAALITLAIVHGISGLVIFFVPIILSIRGVTPLGFSLVGIGGGLIGVGGLMLAFLRTDHPILSRETIFKVLPGLLLAMTLCFVAGFSMGA